MANVFFTVVALSVLPLISGVTAYPWTIEEISPTAEAAGLAVGDRIVSVGDTNIASQDTLIRSIPFWWPLWHRTISGYFAKV